MTVRHQITPEQWSRLLATLRLRLDWTLHRSFEEMGVKVSDDFRENLVERALGRLRNQMERKAAG